MVPVWLVAYLIASFFITWVIVTSDRLQSGDSEGEAVVAGLAVGIVGSVILPMAALFHLVVFLARRLPWTTR